MLWFSPIVQVHATWLIELNELNNLVDLKQPLNCCAGKDRPDGYQYTGCKGTRQFKSVAQNQPPTVNGPMIDLIEIDRLTNRKLMKHC